MEKGYLQYVCALLIFLCSSIELHAQAERITLEGCYGLARANYPTIKKLDLVAKTSGYEINNANRRYLPQISFSGQAGYQSETISFPEVVGSGPGLSLPQISKDQYRIQGDINQMLYDGGNTRKQKELIRANAALQEKNIEASVYGIKQRINSIYFSILLMDAQLKQNQLNIDNLQTQAQKTAAALQNGVAFRSSLDELKAEILNIEMAGTEYRSNRNAYLKMLSLFIGKDLGEGTQLELPSKNYSAGAIARPELQVFNLQRKIYEVQRQQLRTDYMPQVNAFFQGAYGRPTLNIIENKFGPWYIAGLRFNWSISSLYSLKDKSNMLRLNQQSVDADQETFLLNTSVDLSQQDEQVNKYRTLLQQDDEAIALRTAVIRSAEAQLANGVITTHEYIQKVNAEHAAKQTRILHEIQLLQAKYNQSFIAGADQ